jgi:glycosyltransferase involved in cell wall biosynthesis
MTKIFIVASDPNSLRNFRGELIEEMVSIGHKVIVVAPNIADKVHVEAWLNDIQVGYYNLSLERTGVNPFADIRAFAQLYQLMNKEEPEVFLGYTVKPVIWGLLAAWAAGVKNRHVLITGLGYAFTSNARTKKRSFVNFAVKKLYKLALSKAQIVFFQNTDDLQEFRINRLVSAQQNVQVVNGSGVNLQKYAPMGVPSLPVRFLLIARLLGDKGVREFVEAARQLRSQGYNAEFRLVGPIDTNPDAISIEEVRSWCKQRIVDWLGELEDVRPAISECHVFVLPSYREGTPRTVLEAMAMGRPIVTTNAPGCRQTVIDGKNGFLVPVRDPESLANAMKEFIVRPEIIEVMGSASREHVVDKFDVVDVNRNLLSFMGLN